VNRVEIAVSAIERPAWSARLAALARKTLRAVGAEGWEVSFLLCDRQTMSALNARYRGKNTSTDVLTFRQNDFPTPGNGAAAGDVVICLEEVAKNASEAGNAQGEELARLVVHGILHLVGMDHGSGTGGEMLAFQEKLLKELSGAAFFPARLRVSAGRKGAVGACAEQGE
jgi:probable rRNA maturation factor